jgi:hypothetical protein
MNNAVVTPTQVYAFPNLPPPKPWEASSAVLQAARESLEQRITKKAKRARNEKKAALNKAIKNTNTIPSNSPNFKKRTLAVNRARATVNGLRNSVLPSVNKNNVEDKKLLADIAKFKKIVEFENSTRTASAKSKATTTPPRNVFRTKVLSKMKSYKSRTSGSKLNIAQLKKFKVDVLSEMGVKPNSSEINSDSYFMKQYNSPSFKGGKRVTRRNK